MMILCLDKNKFFTVQSSRWLAPIEKQIWFDFSVNFLSAGSRVSNTCTAPLILMFSTSPKQKAQNLSLLQKTPLDNI